MLGVQLLGAEVQAAERPELVVGKAFDRPDQSDPAVAGVVRRLDASAVRAVRPRGRAGRPGPLRGSRVAATRGTVRVSGRAPGRGRVDEADDGRAERTLDDHVEVVELAGGRGPLRRRGIQAPADCAIRGWVRSPVVADPEVLVEIVRSGFVEGHHRGSVVALNADGSTAWSLGDVDVADLSALVQQADPGARHAASRPASSTASCSRWPVPATPASRSTSTEYAGSWRWPTSTRRLCRLRRTSRSTTRPRRRSSGPGSTSSRSR